MFLPARLLFMLVKLGTTPRGLIIVCARASLNNIDIYYGIATTDHIPIFIPLNDHTIPLMALNDTDANNEALD